jgi:hypothetical protein
MKKILAPVIFILVAAVFIHNSLAFALDGQVGIHDPSTIVVCDGKYYSTRLLDADDRPIKDITVSK